ncbi:MAG: hypothetical protein EA428_07930 [Spirochaetaceae bacterium]|nr:MAG: hypothetical protein EA428_07930 [Spirochaetaceae bacterium]
MLSQWIVEYLQWVFLLILLLNLAQRRQYETAARKRLATLYIAAGLILFYAVAHVIRLLEISDWWLLPTGVALVFALTRGESAVRAFRLYCRGCGSRLSLASIVYQDSNLCSDCRFGEPPETPYEEVDERKD